MDLSRRRFFKIAGLAGAASVGAAAPLRAYSVEEARALDAGRNGVLVDTTKCIGCRACEAACVEANHLPAPPEGRDALDVRRETDTRSFTVVNRAGTDPAAPKTRFVKTQCMHCLEPACASACLVRALDKTPNGPVVYHKDRCLGCRYCMVACPFGVPKYEYESPSPFVRKCTFCADRQALGLSPACVSVCPTGALLFGKRADLVERARERIYYPGSPYVRHIYGKEEVGGTSWMYVTDVPFEKLGLPVNLGTYAYSSLTQASLAAVPFVLTLWPPLLMGIYTFSRRREHAASDEHEEASHG